MTHWLQNCCSIDDRPKWMRQPFGVTFMGAEWIVATDAKVMVAVLGDLVPVKFPIGEIIPDAKLNAIAKYLLAPDVPPASVPLVDLERFAPRTSGAVPCPACKGTSAESEFVSCTFCDGDGVMGADLVECWFYGSKINRNSLGRFIHDVPGEACTVQKTKHIEGVADTFHFRGDGWIANVVGLVPSALGDWESAPRFGDEANP